MILDSRLVMWFMMLTENTSFPEAQKQWQVPFGTFFGWKSQAGTLCSRWTKVYRGDEKYTKVQIEDQNNKQGKPKNPNNHFYHSYYIMI